MSKRIHQMTASVALLVGGVALTTGLVQLAHGEPFTADDSQQESLGAVGFMGLFGPTLSASDLDFAQVSELPVDPSSSLPLVAELPFDQVTQSEVQIEGRPTGTGIEGDSNLDDPSTGPDLRPVYTAIEDGDLTRADAILERYRVRYPNFDLPADLTVALNAARLTRDIDLAVNAGNIDDLLALPGLYPAAFSCPNPGNIWRIGDVVAKTNRRAEMLPLYRRVVETCPMPADRFFAIERTLTELNLADAELLLEIERQRADTATDPQRLANLDQRIAERKFAGAFSSGRMRTATAAAMSAAQPGPAIQLGYTALESGDTGTAKRWFDRAIGWGGGVDARIGALETALRRDDLASAEALLKAIPVTDKRYAALEARVKGGGFDTALAAGDLLSAGDAASKNRDAGQATLLGWTYLEQGLTQDAKNWFDQALEWAPGDEAYIGATTTALSLGELMQAREFLAAVKEQSARTDALRARVDLLAAQSLIESGDMSAAIAMIDTARTTAERIGNTDLAAEAEGQLAGLRLAEAQKAYDSGNYAEAKSLADQVVEDYRRTDDDIYHAAMLTAAWSRYQLTEHRAAASRFEQLIDTDLAETASEGLALSLAASNDVARLVELAEANEGAVAQTLRTVGRDQALARDHVQTATMIAGKGLEGDGLKGIGEPWVQAGVAVRYSDGEPGQDRFVSAAPTIAVGVPIGRHRVAGIVRAPIIDTDTPQPGDLVGTPTPVGNMGRFDPTDELYAIEPTLSWTYEAQLQPFAQIGTTPLTGEVSPLPTGEVGAIFHGAGGWRGSASLAASSRRDSLLSLAGIDDPTTGESYGRVVEFGPRIQAVVPVGGGWTMSGEALASTFIGENIVDNDRLGVGAGIAYDLALDGFEYFALGPSYRYETYSENEFFFTLGHGGYFSPQEFHRMALDLNFQTTEYKDFLFRGTAAVGYETFNEDSAPILPDNPGFGRFDASSSSGIAISGLVEGAYLIGPRWQLIGFAGGATASDYTEYVAGLSLRYTFGDRDGLVIRDLFPAQLGFSQR